MLHHQTHSTTPGQAGAGANWDRTGGAQTWVHASFPGARYADHGVRYVTVCGNTVEGRQREKSSKEPRTPSSYAHDSYKEVRALVQGCRCRIARGGLQSFLEHVGTQSGANCCRSVAI